MTGQINKVLVTGAAGLIGSAIVKQLLRRNIAVIACDNFSIGEWQCNDPRVKWLDRDISDIDWDKTLAGEAVNGVVHCAAHPGGLSLAEPVVDVKVNALGSMKIFDWCARNNAKVVYLSSSAVYGPIDQRDPISEHTPLNPGTIYAVCKVACENYLKILAEGKNLKWSVLRLFATYGAGHKPNTHQGIVNIMLTQLMQGGEVVVRGSLDRVRDIIYVDDAARGICEALFRDEASGEIFNLGTQVHLTIRNIIESLAEGLALTENDFHINVQPGTVGDPFYNVADCSKARQFLNFIPEYDFKRGASELIKQRRATLS